MPSVLFIASQPFFSYRGSPIRLGFDVEALAQSGFRVDFLTLPLGQERKIEGVDIIRVGNPLHIRSVPIGPSAAKLFFDLLLYFKARQLCKRHRYDFIHGVEDAGMLAWRIARKHKAVFIFEKHSDPASYRSRSLRNLVMRIYAAIETFLMKRAHAVIGTGPGLVEQARSVAACPVCLIPDIPSSRTVADPGETTRMRERLAPEKETILATYVGSFAVYQGMDLLFASIPKALRENRHLRFVIVGGTEEQIAERRARLAEEGCAERVEFVGLVDPDKLPALLCASDILLSPRLSGVNTPLKLFDYLKAGKAIVATDCPANKLVLDAKTAWLTEIRPEAFARGIVALANNPRQRDPLAARAAARFHQTQPFETFREELAECYLKAENFRNAST